MKNLILVSLLVLLALTAKAQCYVLFQSKQVETAADSYQYNALTGKIVNSGRFGNFAEDATSYIQFHQIDKDSVRAIISSVIDSIMIDPTHYTKYRISTIQGQGGAVNNDLPYGVMSGLYSQDVATFYATIFAVGKGNTRNGKPYPFVVLPLTQQPFIKRAFSLTDAQALTVWNQIKGSL